MTDLARYGLTEKDRQTLLIFEDDACPICLKPFGDARPPAVDHSHGSGAVRGLLCLSCNFALGVLHDDAGWLRRAADYLDEPPADRAFPEPKLVPDAPPHSWRGICWCGVLHSEGWVS